ncbi:hypothetical protein F2981_25015 (plasmid) [Sinorhizobium meliloti]|nr:hypothetical protein [Sinorhizobium meliloti]
MKLSPTPGAYGDFRKQMDRMLGIATEPSPQSSRSIAVPVWVVDGDHEEVVRREDTLFIADSIPAGVY